ncbi:histidine kinase [Fibrisoma montanum]|uniref:histidine kinase n=1 Tax=Fibrisoma montanum TaxID=2305895 RepID=A0A418M3W0_9BACT|nr:sensor histidine kinase [Fibrisoma montanum]RIV20430.1 histidine kinase [Fibrisoma montanum]
MNLIRQVLPRTTNRRIALGFAVALVMIAVGFLMSFYSYTRNGDDSAEVRRTYQTMGQLEDILSTVKDLETSVRGYMLSNDRSFLEHYEAALTSLPVRMRTLRKSLADHPLQQQRADSLAWMIEEKMVYANRLLREADNMDSRSRPIYLRLGKVKMDQIRQAVATMMETEQALMKERTAQSARSYRNTLLIIFALSVLTFISLIISYTVLENELDQRQRTEDQLRSYEQELREKIRQLEASNEELERFAFVASHDLQEPLRKIQSFANLISERYSTLFDDDSKMFLRKITHSAERMSRLIKDLLNFSRVSNQRTGFRPVRLGDIVQRVLDDQELRIKGLDVDLSVDRLPAIEAIPVQMDHLFTNLVSNALKFTRPGVRPMLRISARVIDGSLYPELIPQKSYVEITVEDNGIGFDEKYLDHIFKVFQRLHGKTVFEGTGIGLAICKRIVVHHNGYITARSQPDQGSVFVVVLPEQQSTLDYEQSTSGETYSYFAG